MLEQPYEYRRASSSSPTGRRLPGFADVTAEQWRSAQWQRVNCVKNLKPAPRASTATCSTSRSTPTSRPTRPAAPPCRCCCRRRCSTRWCRGEVPTTAAILRRPGAPLHAPGRLRPAARRRPPAPVRRPRLAARARHVGRRGADPPLPHQGARRAALDLPAVLRPLHPHGPGRQLHARRRQAEVRRSSRSTGTTPIIDYLRAHPGRPRRRRLRRRRGQRAVASNLESFLDAAARDRDHPRHPAGHQGADGLPQHWLAATTSSRAWSGSADDRPARGVNLAIHTHVNHAQSVTPLVAEAAQTVLEVGVRDVRNQGVLMRGVNDSAAAAARPVLRAAGRGRHPPYYFYMCDMIPNAEHWRVSRGPGADAAARHHGLPARLRDAADRLRRARSSASAGCTRSPSTTASAASRYWTKNYRTGIERTDEAALDRRYAYYDPIDTLPESGQAWWAEREHDPVAAELQGRDLAGGVGRRPAGLSPAGSRRSSWSNDRRLNRTTRSGVASWQMHAVALVLRATRRRPWTTAERARRRLAAPKREAAPPRGLTRRHDVSARTVEGFPAGPCGRGRPRRPRRLPARRGVPGGHLAAALDADRAAGGRRGAGRGAAVRPGAAAHVPGRLSLRPRRLPGARAGGAVGRSRPGRRLGRWRPGARAGPGPAGRRRAGPDRLVAAVAVAGPDARPSADPRVRALRPVAGQAGPGRGRARVGGWRRPHRPAAEPGQRTADGPAADLGVHRHPRDRLSGRGGLRAAAAAAGVEVDLTVADGAVHVYPLVPTPEGAAGTRAVVRAVAGR